jgi:hypothetical protein
VATKLIACIALALCIAHAQDRPAKPKLKWVIAAVSFQSAANTADIISSWQQPEATKWLATNGRFQAKAIGVKISISGAVSAGSILIARRWPHTRKLVEVFNIAIGAPFAGAAAYNFHVNPRWSQ